MGEIEAAREPAELMRIEMEIGEETVDGSVGEGLFVEVLCEEDETHLF